MLLNYMKSEWYRIARSKEGYLLVGVLCAIVLAANVLLAVMAGTPDFPYATARFSLSNVIMSLGALFLVAGLLVWLLFGDDRKNGTLKNEIAQGLARRDLFAGKCLVSIAWGLMGLAVILIVYVGSAALLLEGPVLEPATHLVKGVLSALPFTVACVVLAVAACIVSPKPANAFMIWLTVVCLVPVALDAVGRVVEPVAVLASWMPYNFFANEVLINMSGAAEFLWDTPQGLAKCLISGFAGIAAFSAAGLWRIGKTEL